jgi:hypothetical protein
MRDRRMPKARRQECDAYPSLVCSSRPQVDHRQRYHGAAMGTEAVRLLVLWMAGWIHSRQLEVIDSLREENRVLREQIATAETPSLASIWPT